MSLIEFHENCKVPQTLSSPRTTLSFYTSFLYFSASGPNNFQARAQSWTLCSPIQVVCGPGISVFPGVATHPPSSPIILIISFIVGGVVGRLFSGCMTRLPVRQFGVLLRRDEVSKSWQMLSSHCRKNDRLPSSPRDRRKPPEY